MSVGEAFLTSGQIYVMGFAVALGMAALIKLICFVIGRSEARAAAKAIGGFSEASSGKGRSER